MFPYNQQLSQMLLQNSLQQTQKQEVIKVNGRGGANAFQMAPDSSVLLLDTTAPIIWFAQTDGAGYKTLLPYDITPHKEEKEVDVYKSLEDRITKLEETVNAKSNSTSAKRKSESAE